MDDLPESDILNDQLEPDAIFVTGLQEAKWILLMWLCCFIWTLSYCISNGYQSDVDPESFPTVMGIPSWVAWGIGLPWIVANVATVVFCFGYMKDGDLEPDDLPTGTSCDVRGSRE